MKLKTIEVDGNTYAEMQDGKPVYVGDDGKEVAVDAAELVGSVNHWRKESDAAFKARDAAKAELRKFDGIEDPKAAKEAMEKLANLKDKDLVEAGKVDEIKAAAIAAVEEKYKPVVAENDTLKSELYSEKIGGSFARSKFISEKVAVPADIIQARFGSNFKIEEGKVIAYDQAGNAIYSKANPGNPAAFDEALEILVDQYPYKDSILKGTGGSGSGKPPGQGGGGSNGKRQLSRAEFDGLNPAQRQAVVADVGAGKATITD